MALDPNINRIKFLRSKISRRKPTISDIEEGEIAINLTDRTLYSRNGNNIVDIGFGLGGSIEGSISATGNVSAPNLIATNQLTTPKINSSAPLAVLSGWDAQGINVSQLLVSNQYDDVNKVPNNGAYIKGNISCGSNVTAISFNGELNGNATTATKLQTPRLINDVLFDGTADIKASAYYSVMANTGDRTIRPNGLPTARTTMYFVSKSGLNGTASSDYGDFIAFNNYFDQSGGSSNSLFFSKSGNQEILHYRSPFSSSSWGTPKTIAYTDSDSTGNSATATRLKDNGFIAGTNASWVSLGTFTIPMNGSNIRISVLGGSGFNFNSPQQPTTSEIVIRSTNGLPSDDLNVVCYVKDGSFSSTIQEVAYKRISDSKFEVFSKMSGYYNFYYFAEYAGNTTVNIVPVTTNSTTLPSGATLGTMKTIALLTSNVASATKLQTARSIFGQTFDGTNNVSGQATVSNINNTSLTGLPFLNGADAQKILTGGVLASNNYGDSSLVPTNGIFSKGEIVTHSQLSIKNQSWPAIVLESTQGAYSTTIETTGSYPYVAVRNKTTNVNLGAFYFPNQTGTQNLATESSNVASATKLQTARQINGISFDGTADINVQPKAERVPPGGDLNYYVNEGVFYCDADDDVARISNAPRNQSFTLTVSRTAGVTQTWITYNGGQNVMYVRGMYNNSWSAWKQVVYSTDTIANAADAQWAAKAALADSTTALQNGRNFTMGNASRFFNGTQNITMTLADMGAIGHGQTYENVTGQRAFGSTYTNSTGRPIYVSITKKDSYGNQGDEMYIQVDGRNATAVASNTGYNIRTSMSAIVPAGSTYRLAGTDLNFTLWTELR